MSCWRSARVAWVLLLAVGALALHLYDRLRSAEAEFSARSRGLEAELRSAMAQKDAMAEAVQKAADERERQREERQRRRRQALEPMPEGVRLALVALRDCLRAEGHDGLRVLRARSLVERSLREVELWDYEPEQLLSTLYVVGRMELVLDRSSGALTLRFFDGYLSRHGQREDFPADGFELLLSGVNGPMWEARLPYLVQAVESYPEEGPVPVRSRLDPFTARQWQQRLDLLLDQAETSTDMRIGPPRSLDDGAFREIVLSFYDDSILVMSAEADRMVVRVDEAGGVVQLVLSDGLLRNAAGETPIDAAGYRILLPGVSPARAREIMMGMVAER